MIAVVLTVVQKINKALKEKKKLHELDGPEAASSSIEIANNVAGRLFRHTHCLLEVAARGNALPRQKLMHPLLFNLSSSF